MSQEPGGGYHDPGHGAHPSQIDLDVRCVRCGYNLRGLTMDRMCPECGTPIWASYTPHRTSGLAIASMVVGIVSIPSCMMYGIPSIVCGIVAVVLANQADRQIVAGQASPASLGMVKAGRVCGKVGIGLSLAFWFIIALVVFIAQF